MELARLDLADARDWFADLYERPVELHLEQGYVKEKEARNEPDHQVHPFVFLPKLQRQIFDACVEAWAPATERDVLDCYFTSYFNAWLDDQNLYSGPKRVVTGFTPRLAMEDENAARFFSAYPDGTLVSIVRDARGWYASASRYRSELYDDLDEAIGLWARSAQAALVARARFGERVLVLTYEQLVLDTERTMERVAGRIGIPMAPVLLAPTFNGRPVRANSSARVDRPGIVADRADAHRDVLDAATAARIDELTGGLYARVAALAEEGG